MWNADPGTAWPTSDPAPETAISPGNWTARPWRDVAVDAMAAGHAGHLCVLDADGYPLPMRARSIQLVDAGFRLDMPDGVPWSYDGKGSITFAGYRSFVGEVLTDGDAVLFRVERALPQHPSTLDTKQVLQPAETTVAKTRARLEFEMARRGQPLVEIPETAPERTRIAKIRMARIASDAPITGLTVAHGNRAT